MYQHGTPIVLNGKLLKNPNLASHYACMRHLGVIYGQTSQSLPPHGYVVLTLFTAMYFNSKALFALEYKVMLK